jgi:hypothetical protein
MSAPPEAIAPNPHTNLLNAYIQSANKMGFKQKTKTNAKYCQVTSFLGTGLK